MSKEKPVFCVIGAGHGGMAMAAHLSILGFEVRLFNRTSERLKPIQIRRGIDVTGEITGFARIETATDNPEEALSGADVVMIAIPATGHRSIAAITAPFLKSDQYVVLNPGRTFGAIEFHQVLKSKDANTDVTIAETQTFLYASRVTGPGQVKIFRIKNSVPLATFQAHRIPGCLDVVRKAYPQFVPGDNIFKTSFNNIGAIFHPALVLLNAGWIEDQSDFEFYFQGASPSVSKILDKLDAERVAVAAALGIQAMTARDWLYFAYGAAGKTLRESMRANSGYHGILAPHQTEMRYVTEDIPCSIVPMSSLGRQMNIPTPVMDSIITLASAMHGRDYYAEGRTMEKMGIDKMDLKQLRLLGIGEMQG
ncbi:MAG: NADP transhydrogenase subunit alpha [Candidatus Raymondbacteria bacterium RifOxyA12_full_50_37]|uniref:NADP transhydrogenase subunit alpha n=1 Tax=Candidatus Raymondbacteria bacterium RIFOXYD12_FULL_49_13 TaxID=1817890 RepID=A0A1F7FAF0_UNCRA|nr:MAG: NADP transhydrogenase subunit alpha [Candidatus Raymondbacteria bacterium RifOxyA12_full_50_37]OGJ90041.1 MAG: NADP transhydrogenase subunit alpha [Candidatus Raymondbacteria bacterium RIFOXYA2_FULL_49_16]OGJ96682.1 MAG: NADP transhydrogenase subunit alpha [Candidatus Raymondbacteria bacterium RifOxyB12_full_50_8]OGJ96725.1 MAG: NADP transhydrogenase subunit alpha [Candidatus Raymondbacteria bacterium RIFOXYC2_FULL_50_21]OGK03476.1 MAG: NADP transhydrogenase subunit alpha [Candidatus Ra